MVVVKYVFCFVLYQEEEDGYDVKAYGLFSEGACFESRGGRSVLTQVLLNFFQSITPSLNAPFSSTGFGRSLTNEYVEEKLLQTKNFKCTWIYAGGFSHKPAAEAANIRYTSTV